MKPPKQIIFSLLPWGLYLLGRLTGMPAWGLTGAVVLMAIALSMRWSAFKATDWTQGGLFATLLIGVHVLRVPWLHDHQSLLAPGVFMFLSFGSLLIGQPFTTEYALEQVPDGYWDDPVFPLHFHRVNQILTAGWGLAFGLALLCAWLAGPAETRLFSWTQLVAWTGFALIGLATVFFPPWYQRQVYLPVSCTT